MHRHQLVALIGGAEDIVGVALLDFDVEKPVKHTHTHSIFTSTLKAFKNQLINPSIQLESAPTLPSMLCRTRVRTTCPPGPQTPRWSRGRFHTAGRETQRRTVSGAEPMWGCGPETVEPPHTHTRSDRTETLVYYHHYHDWVVSCQRRLH